MDKVKALKLAIKALKKMGQPYAVEGNLFDLGAQINLHAQRASEIRKEIQEAVAALEGMIDERKELSK